MKVEGSPPRKGRWKKILAAAGVGIALLGVGILAGYAIGVAKRAAYHSTPDTALESSSSSSVLNDPSKWRELPSPGTDAARLLLAQPGTPAWMHQLYTYNDDSRLITEEATRTFLVQLQEQLPSVAAAAADKQQQGGDIKKLVEGQVPAGRNSTGRNEVNLTPFIGVAFDVLNYLRYHNSESLLLLLREFTRTGALALESVDPDSLRGEVERLFNVSNLQRWYLANSRVDGWAHGQQQQQQGGRRLQGIPLPSGHLRRLQQLHRSKQRQQQQTRRLQAGAAAADPMSVLLAQMTGAGAAAPGASDAEGPEGRASKSITTAFSEAQQQQITSLVCSVQRFSPVGLQKVLGGAACPPPAPAPPATEYSEEQTAFRPVKLPVVFHVFRFLAKDGSLLPPWGDRHEAMARNLISESNKLYSDSGIEFVFQEVRNNPQQYAYLTKASLSAWQRCTYNQAQPRDGLSCLTRTAKKDEVSEVVSKKHAINVFVGGSRQPSFCNPESAAEQGTFMRRRLQGAEAAPLCSSLALGETTAAGPWWPEPSADWSEDKSEANWIFLNWDQFDSDTTNSARFWNGGACTLSHELGHYLGLLHPHQDGPAPCGTTDPDAVADTPINLRVDQAAATKNLLADLTAWCAEFRKGSGPPASELTRFNSCRKEDEIDNVFLIMGYVPDACCMLLTDIQKERLKWAIALYRPELMKANAVA